MATGPGPRRARPRVEDWQRRARLAQRHRLTAATRARDVEGAVDAVVGLHATDAATVFLSAAARTVQSGPAQIEQALYDRNTLVRMTGMRRTVFVFPVDLAPAILVSTSRPLALRDRAALLRLLEVHLGWTSVQLAELEDAVIAAVGERGEATGGELAVDVPALRMKITPSVTPGAPLQSISMRVLYNLAMTGRIVRRRPVGRWTSSQYRWALGPGHGDVDPGQARADLVSRYLAQYGPATEADVKWWTGWTVTHTRAALSDQGAVEVDLNGGVGYVVPDDLEAAPVPEPWVALLPALDCTAMGWKHRDWYLAADHITVLFDRSGNIGPTVWCDGRIVGGWAQRRDGRVVYRLLTDVGAEARAAIEAEAGRLG